MCQFSARCFRRDAFGELFSTSFSHTICSFVTILQNLIMSSKGHFFDILKQVEC